MRDDAVLGRALPLDRGLGPEGRMNNSQVAVAFQGQEVKVTYVIYNVIY